MENKSIHKIFGTLILFALVLVIPQVSAVSDFVTLDDYIIDYEYENVEAGERFTLKVTVTNDDNDIRESIDFELDASSPFDLISDEDWDIGDLEEGESKSRTFRLEVDEDVDSDDYEIEFKLEDSDDEYDDLFEIEVSSNKAELIVGDMRSEPTTIIPDTKDVKLIVDIENTGDEDAKFVKAKLILPNGFTPSNSYSHTANLGVIKAGESKTATFTVDIADTVPENLFFANVELEFENSNHKKSKTLEVELPVQGTPQFSVKNVKSDTPLMQGSSATLSFDVTNIGTKEAGDTTIKIFEKAEFPFDFEEKTSFVGTLQEGMSATATFNVDVESDAVAKDYLLTVQIRTVHEGNVLVTEETIIVNVGEYQRGVVDLLKITFMILALGTVGLFGIFFYKKNKSRKL